MFDEERADDARSLLARLRKDTNRSPKAVLHWNQMPSHSDRVHVSVSLGVSDLLTVSSVIVCKNRLAPAPEMSHAMRYLFSFRMLLERLTWYGKSRQRKVHYTLAAIKGVHASKLAEYKDRLFESTEPTGIEWRYLDGLGDIDQPLRNEFLQLADLGASATGAAFNPDKHGRVEPTYLLRFASRLYRREGGALTSYGLKLHPGSGLADHPWISDLK